MEITLASANCQASPPFSLPKFVDSNLLLLIDYEPRQQFQGSLAWRAACMSKSNRWPHCQSVYCIWESNELVSFRQLGILEAVFCACFVGPPLAAGRGPGFPLSFLRPWRGGSGTLLYAYSFGAISIYGRGPLQFTSWPFVVSFTPAQDLGTLRDCIKVDRNSTMETILRLFLNTEQVTIKSHKPIWSLLTT